MVKNLPANARDAGDGGSIPGLGRSPGEGNGNPLQYSCLEKSHRQRSLVDCSPWNCRVRLDLATKQINKLLEGRVCVFLVETSVF